MAGHKGIISTPVAVAFTSGTRKTLLSFKAHASVDTRIRGFGVMNSDATATDAAALGFLETLAAEGSGGTAIAAASIVNELRTWDATTYPFLGTGRYGDTTPGTQGVILMPLHLEMKNGGIIYHYPPGDEPVIARGTVVALSLTTAADLTGCVGFMLIEE